MPESRKRKRDVYAAPLPSATKRRPPSPPWLAPFMLALFLVGIVWLVVYYLSNGTLPLGKGYDIFIGFGFIVAGFAVATQWR